MQTTKHTKTVRAALIVLGLVTLVAAAGLSLRIAPFTEIWPLADSVVVERFLGAYMAGIGASLLWIGVSGELGVAVAGAISLTIVYAGLALTWLTLPLGAAAPQLRPIALLCIVGAVVSARLALWFRRFPIRDAQLLPRPVYISFVVFVLLLAFVGVAVQVGLPYSYPVTLGSAAAALIGCSFLGSAAYFLYGLMFPVWGNVRAPLWGFLAYDLALIVPLVSRLGAVDAAHRPALVAYVAVLVFSGALAIYYLLIAPATRIWAPRPGQDEREERMVAPPEEAGVAERETVGVVAQDSGWPESRGDGLV
jgi:hypothetical protein